MPQPKQDFTKPPRRLEKCPPPYSGGNKMFRWDYPGGNPPSVLPATLRYASDFDTGSIEPFAIKGTDSVAVVEINKYNGKKTLRGNLFTGTTAFIDPHTGKSSNNNPLNFNLSTKTSGSSRQWEQVYIRYRLRFDRADNRDKDGNPTNMKLGYFSDLYNEATGNGITSTQSAIYPTLTVRGKGGIGSLFRNGADAGRYDPVPVWPASAIQTGGVDRGMAFDGQWNLVEILFDYVKGIMNIWINENKIVASSTQAQWLKDLNGDWPIDSNFTMDQFSLFHADEEEWRNSSDGEETKGGFHIADFECWENDPRPWGL